MKPKYTPLKKLNDKSKGFKLKVKIVQKTDPAESPSKRRYQKLVFRDEEGNTMKGTLFGSDIETYEQALKRNGEYELSDVHIKHLPPQFRTKPDEEYQMNLGGWMKIRALDLSQCFDEPQYRQRANIPTTFSADNPLLDVVAAVIFVGEQHEEIFAGYTQKTRDIILADQSLSRPMKLTARNRYAFNDAAAFITNWHETYQVVGFTGIRPYTYKGLSLSTTVSSAYIANPTGTVPEAVQNWVGTNMTLLSDWRAKAMLIYSDAPSKIVTPLANIAQKKASTIWQDEYYWVTVNLPYLQAQDVYSYYGCGKCGKRVSGEPGTKTYCHYCYTKDATVESRLVLNSEIADATGTLKITAYTAKIEKLLDAKAAEFPRIGKQDNSAVNKLINELKNKQFLVRICPNHELSTANVLKWIVNAVEAIPSKEADTSDDVLTISRNTQHVHPSKPDAAGKTTHTDSETTHADPAEQTARALIAITSAATAQFEARDTCDSEYVSKKAVCADQSQIPETEEDNVSTLDA